MKIKFAALYLCIVFVIIISITGIALASDSNVSVRTEEINAESTNDYESYPDEPEKNAAADIDSEKADEEYVRAEEHLSQKEYELAHEIYESLGEYRDCTEKEYLTRVIGIVDQSYEMAQGVLAYRYHEHWGIINLIDNNITPPEWDSIGNSLNSFGLVKVSRGEKYGYVNQDGEVVITCKWEGISDFNDDGFCTVASYNKTNNILRFGICNINNVLITRDMWLAIGDSYFDDEYYYCRVPRTENGFYKVQQHDRKWGLMDVEGNVVVKPQWVYLDSFSEGLALVKNSLNHVGYINMEGEVVIKPSYKDAGRFSEGLAAVQLQNGKWQYIDYTGAVIITGKFGAAESFSNGYADVRIDGSWYIINKQGNIVYFINPKYSKAVKLMEEGEYEKAAELFDSVESSDVTPDTDLLAEKCRLLYANQLIDAGEPGAALEYLTAYESNEEVEKVIKKAHYYLGLHAFNLNDYDQVRAELALAEGYQDEIDRLNEIHFALAEKAYAESDYDTALTEYSAAGNYMDAYDKTASIYYLKAEESLTQNDEKSALAWFNKAGNYKDAQKRMMKIAFNRKSYDAVKGAVLTIGTYPQDDQTATPVDWLVLEVNQNEALMLSLRALDTIVYTNQKNVAWNTSNVRNWMNKDFYERAFSQAEKKLILQKTQKVVDEQSNKRSDIKDKIFALGCSDVKRYFRDAASAICLATPYAKQQGAKMNELGYCDWWLRDQTGKLPYAVTQKGVNRYHGMVEEGVALRPAMWIDLEKYAAMLNME